MHLEMTMHMALQWKTSVSFIFESWTVDSTFGLIVGLIIASLVSFMGYSLPYLRKNREGKLHEIEQEKELFGFDEEQDEGQKNRKKKEKSISEELLMLIFYFSYSLLSIATMMLIMTYNGFVILAVLVGYTFGIYFFSQIRHSHSYQNKHSPIDCCN